MDHKHTQPNGHLAAGLTGFLLGVAGTSVIILSDEDTRKKLSKKAQHVRDHVKNWSKKTLDDLSTQKQKAKTTADDIISDSEMPSRKDE